MVGEDNPTKQAASATAVETINALKKKLGEKIVDMHALFDNINKLKEELKGKSNLVA